jgi:hypothetical protein
MTTANIVRPTGSTLSETDRKKTAIGSRIETFGRELARRSPGGRLKAAPEPDSKITGAWTGSKHNMPACEKCVMGERPRG